MFSYKYSLGRCSWNPKYSMKLSVLFTAIALCAADTNVRDSAKPFSLYIARLSGAIKNSLGSGYMLASLPRDLDDETMMATSMVSLAPTTFVLMGDKTFSTAKNGHAKLLMTAVGMNRFPADNRFSIETTVFRSSRLLYNESAQFMDCGVYGIRLVDNRLPEYCSLVELWLLTV